MSSSGLGGHRAVNMQRSSSGQQGTAPAAGPLSKSRDPRIRGGLNSTPAAGAVGAVNGRASASRRETTPSAIIWQSTSGRLDNTPSISPEPLPLESQFQKTCHSYFNHVIDLKLCSLKQNRLKDEANVAQQDYERELKRSHQFPTAVQSYRHNKDQINALCDATKREENDLMEKVRTSEGDLIRLVLDKVDRFKDEIISTVSNQIGTLLGPRSEESERLRQSLEEFQRKQESKNRQFEISDDKVNNIGRKAEEDVVRLKEADQDIRQQFEGFKSQQHAKDREFKEAQQESRRELEGFMSEQRAKDKELKEAQQDIRRQIEGFKSQQRAKDKELKEAYQDIRRQIEGLKSQQHATDKDVKEIINGLKAETDALRKSLESLEQKSTSTEASVRDSLESELNGKMQEFQEKVGREHKQALDRIARARKGLHLSIEKMQQEWEGKYGDLRTNLCSLPDRLSTLEGVVKASDASAAADREQIATLQIENRSLKEELKDKFGIVTQSTQHLSAGLNSVQTRLGQLATIPEDFDANVLNQKMHSLDAGFEEFTAAWRIKLDDLREKQETVGKQVELQSRKWKQFQEESGESIKSCKSAVAAVVTAQHNSRVLTTELDLLREEFARKIGEENKNIRLQLAHIANKLHESGQALNQEGHAPRARFANHDMTFEGYLTDLDHVRASEVPQIQRERENVMGFEGLCEQHALTNGDRHGASVRKPTSGVSEHFQVRLKRNQIELARLFFQLTKRFDDLIDQCFTYTKVGSVRKYGPKSERRIDEVLIAVEKIHNKSESHQQTIDSLMTKQGKIERDVEKLKSKDEALEKQFEEARDSLSKEHEDLTTAVGRAEGDQSTYRQLPDQTIPASQAMADATVHDLNGFKPPPLLPSGNLRGARRPEAETASMSANSGSQAVPDESTGGTKRVADTVHGIPDNDDQDSDRTVLIRSSKPVTPQSTRSSTQQAPRSAARRSRSNLKRTHAQSQDPYVDLTHDSDEDNNRRPKRRTRR